MLPDTATATDQPMSPVLLGGLLLGTALGVSASRLVRNERRSARSLGQLERSGLRARPLIGFGPTLRTRQGVRSAAIVWYGHQPRA